ncbi:MAG TPA: IPT/TIG domain-containing protein, partial [Verrucomicrobiae bacterium]|nr:IPT/TIG domain-containing protein [Verrucomicrobiae bacterium]
SDISSSAQVAIPSNTWKIVTVVPAGGGAALSRITTTNRVISLLIPNTSTVSSAWQDYITSAHQIELQTGFTFFTALPGAVASALRSRIDGLINPPGPVIAGFSPTSGMVNGNIVITGTNFNSASAVKFNGTSAVFTVDSNTQIRTTVPAGATFGTLSLTTPGGTATSTGDFTVDSNTLPDLVIAAAHSSNFTQGDTGDTCTIFVNNVGNAPSSGTITVSSVLPTGLTATAISGTGWLVNLGALTATRSDALAAGAAYPALSVTVNVASSAPARATNTVAVSGGSDANLANNTASDVININPSAASETLVGWDVSGQTDFGVSPLSPTTNAANLTVGGLTRGAGVGTSGSGAARAWGGTGFTNIAAAAAAGANQFITFTLAANTGYKVSYSSINKFDYRRSATGSANGVLQYQIGSGAFTDIAPLSYPANTSAGGSIGLIDLSGVAALQNVGAGTNVTFRIVNWNGTSAAGTWYVFDAANTSAPDLAVQGSVTPAVMLTPVESWRLQWFGTTNDAGEAADGYAGTADGLANLVKYALGLNPLIPMNNPVVSDISTGYLRLTVPKNPEATDVTFHVEATGDLTAPWSGDGLTIDQDTPTLLQGHADTPVASSTSGFIRVRVTRP